jgi:hypothetical protein
MPLKKTRTHSNTRPAKDDASSSGFRAAARLPAPDEPPLVGAQPKADAELERRVFTLVTAVSQDDGMVYTPEWAAVADVAKRRGYLEEHALRLYVRKHGEQWLESFRAKPTSARLTMQKLSPASNLRLKDLARATGVPMREVLGHLIDAIDERRDELTRVARKHGAEYPWEAIRFLVK